MDSSAPGRETRKVVTALFCDVAGFTAAGERLDPEALRRLQSRYFEAARTALERHGGTVEKFIGDAVMAVFGIPQAHEDDALRAMRAALELRRAVTELELEARIGVNTGEVVVGAGEALATGDAVNTAARLEQAASPGEILLGTATHALVARVVEVEPLEPLSLHGKTGSVAAFRLLSLDPDAEAIARRFDTPLVGRERELARLLAAFQHARETHVCELVSIIGDAGLGKSRLAHELLERAASEAKLLRGRCLPYGEGITYWPLVEILEQLGEQPPEGPLRAVTGDAGEPATPDDISWAARKLFERLAEVQPLIVVLDDVQWAESTFLDLVENVALLSRGRSLLLVCLARPELLDARPGWPGERIVLAPLSPEDALQLIEGLGGLDPHVRERISQGSGGNPLFVEQMVALAAEEADGELAVPPTIQALLTARLDRLPHADRRTLEAASVIGEEFWESALRTASSNGDALEPALVRLVRAGLIRPDDSSLAGEDAFRFAHLLVRDAAYAALPKERRAEVHERVARWHEGRGAEHDELVGYHLEQACHHSREIGLVDDRTEGLAAEASERLAAAAGRAERRGDVTATAALLRRAVELLHDGHPLRARLLHRRADALWTLGEYENARRLTEEAIDEASGGGDVRTEWRARTLRAWIDLARSAGWREFEVVALDAVRTLEEEGDHAGVIPALLMLTQVYDSVGRAEDGHAAAVRALSHARELGDPPLESWARGFVWRELFHGAEPVEDVVEAAIEGLDWARSTGNAWIEYEWTRQLARAYALAGRVAEARALIARVQAAADEVDHPARLADAAWITYEVELAAGDVAAAESALRQTFRFFEAAGDKGYVSTVAALLAHVVLDRGETDEALELVALGERALDPDDLSAVIPCLTARARALARRGDTARAIELIESAIDRSSAVRSPHDRADVFLHAADVHRVAGRLDDAARAAETAWRLYEQKGSRPFAQRARAILEELRAGVS